MTDAAVAELVERALDVASSAGAAYADARYLCEEHESVDVENDHLSGVQRGTSAGIGIRVIVDGAWGFAATARLGASEIEAAARLAVDIARASGLAMGAPVRLAEEPTHRVRWETPVAEDPFAVPLSEKVDLLLAATAAMRGADALRERTAMIDLWRRTSVLATSEGTRIEQRIVQTGAGIRAVAVGEDVQVRSYPNSFRGHFATMGFEHVRRMRLLEEAPRVAEEAAALLRAPECPSTTTTLILDPTQVALQVHESVGHATELDRVLGMEAAYAGTSFVSVRDVGTLRYGSDLVTITADATLPGGLGSFGFDDEGVQAQRSVLVERGVLRGFTTSRETAAEAGITRSNGTMRADSWNSIPLVRMTNINLEPGDSSLAQMIEETDDGLYMETNRSWSIDDKRVNFQFGCEAAWEIRKGARGRLLRNPNYDGKTVEFWSSCDAVAGPDEWRVWGTPNCGKGQPGQTARVGHGTAAARFRNVRVGVRP